MRTLADLKRAMQIGTKWNCVYHPACEDRGDRVIVRVKTGAVAFDTVRNDGERVESWFYFPKASDLEFLCGDTAIVLRDGKPFMSYRKAD